MLKCKTMLIEIVNLKQEQVKKANSFFECKLKLFNLNEDEQKIFFMLWKLSRKCSVQACKKTSCCFTCDKIILCCKYFFSLNYQVNLISKLTKTSDAGKGFFFCEDYCAVAFNQFLFFMERFLTESNRGDKYVSEE